MRTPARAFAWEFGQRHRWAFIAAVGYLFVIATINLLMLRSGQHISIRDGERFAAMVTVPLTSIIVYFLAAFTFGLSGDVAARQSMYPARLFTLPVSTTALVRWPMLYGTTVLVVLWAAVRVLAVWPSDYHVPVVWPALFLASLLAWAQALMWMPYGLPGMRVVITVFWLMAIDTTMLVALHYEVSERVMLALLAPLVPLAYLVAHNAVARARRGDIPDWRPMEPGRGSTVSLAGSRQGNFASPHDAQAWFEWRRHGATLPWLVAILLPFELALLFLAGDATSLVVVILLGALFTPPFMAAIAAATIGKANPLASDAHGMSPFMATRPLTSVALITAKFKMAIWSTVTAWLLVLLAIPIGLAWSGTWPLMAEKAGRLAHGIGTPRALALLLLILAAFIASTWRQLVQGFYIGLSGSSRIIRTNAVLLVVFLVAIGPVADWIFRDEEMRASLWDALPLIVALLVGVKMAAAGWIASRLYRSRLLEDGALVAGAATWLASVLGLYAVFVWYFSTPLFPRYFLMLVAILAVPLARVAASPLALARGRHR